MPKGFYCATCCHWEPIGPKRKATTGLCRRNAPAAGSVAEGAPHACWPKVWLDDWCGEHQVLAKAAKTPR